MAGVFFIIVIIAAFPLPIILILSSSRCDISERFRWAILSIGPSIGGLFLSSYEIKQQQAQNVPMFLQGSSTGSTLLTLFGGWVVYFIFRKLHPKQKERKADQEEA